MTTLIFRTTIDAPQERCFDLARSIDLHQLTMTHTKERAIDGVKTGLIKEGEFVTWEATHLGVRQTLSTRIPEMRRPHYFIDEMTKGAFRSLWHLHSFRRDDNKTIMLDEFRYDVPLGVVGVVFNIVFLKRYMTGILEERNRVIKEAAESDQWRMILPEEEQ